MAENIENNGCSQRDNAEHEGYVKASRSFNRIWKERDSAQPRLLEAILYKDNFNRAYKRVKANKGAPGIDGMTIEEALPYLKEHQQEITDRIYRGKYTPSPVRRVEIPKPDGGVRKLGIPTVIDRTIQQAITQELVPIYEPLFADGSFGYRPGRSAKDAIQKVKEYAEQGYTYAVSLDLSKYFDTLNHEILLNLLRKNVKDERVVQLIKRYLKSGVMENGVVMETEEGSPQGGNLSPLLANIYLNEFDQEFLKRGVPCVRYADDIVLLAKSKRASERLLESSTKYLEEKLKLTVNRKKSRTVSVFAIRNFKYLGFALGRNGTGIYVRVHPKSWRKFKSRLKELSSRKRCQSIKPSLEKIKIYARGWLNYYGIASMKNNIEEINGWLYHRIRMCIWKQWKLPKTKKRNLIKMGVHEYYANMAANCRRGHWYCANLTTVKKAMTKERLIKWGFYDLATVVVLETKSGKEKLGIIPCSSGMFKRLIELPGKRGTYILAEEVILHYMPEIFKGYRVKAKSLIRITRNADIDADALYDEDLDYRDFMVEVIKQRKKLAPIRLELSREMDGEVISTLCHYLDLDRDYVFYNEGPLDLSFVYEIQDKLRYVPELFYQKRIPQKSVQFEKGRPILDQILRGTNFYLIRMTA